MFEDLFIAPNKMDQLTGIGLRSRAHDRRIKEGGASCSDSAREFLDPARCKRAGFDRDCSGAEADRRTVAFVAPDRARRLIVADHGDDHFGTLRRHARGFAINGAGSHQFVDR
jgi:hypothetical protein